MEIRSTKAAIAVAAAGCLFASAIGAQTVSVGTDSSFSATYIGNVQNGGPYPWSDLGITATAGVAPGNLDVATGGATSFDLANAPVANQVLGFNSK